MISIVALQTPYSKTIQLIVQIALVDWVFRSTHDFYDIWLTSLRRSIRERRKFRNVLDIFRFSAENSVILQRNNWKMIIFTSNTRVSDVHEVLFEIWSSNQTPLYLINANIDLIDKKRIHISISNGVELINFLHKKSSIVAKRLVFALVVF